MLKAIAEISRIGDILTELVDAKVISDFRAILRFDMTIDLHVVFEGDQSTTEISLQEALKNRAGYIEIAYHRPSDIVEDTFLEDLFNRKDRVDLGRRRTLDSLHQSKTFAKTFTTPVVSFYSYKGGVGRTTSLVLFAAHLSTNHGKKVFILDLDLEAPGLVNFFGLHEDATRKGGVVEYIKDKEFDNLTKLDSSYVFEIPREYVGEGAVWGMLSGSIIEKADRDDFLEGLARLDLFGSELFLQSLNSLITDIEARYSPDVILVDSRTGYNDIFGTIVNHLSDVGIGIFGNNVQNLPGLYFYLDTFLENNNISSIILVNSIVSSSISRNIAEFKTKVEAYVEERMAEHESSLPAIPIFAFTRNVVLENIGTRSEDKEDFISVVRDRTLNDYVVCFEKILEILTNKPASSTQATCPKPCTGVNVNEATCPSLNQAPICNNNSSQATPPHSCSHKDAILAQLHANFPQPYAENIDFSDSFLHQQFYLRKAMEEVFSLSKFALCGGKGTGKTALYLALQNPSFFSGLQKRAQKSHLRYAMLKSASLVAADGRPSNLFFGTNNFDQSSISDPDFFYKRFWVVYIWLILMNDKQAHGVSPTIETFKISDDSRTAGNFKRIIADDKLFAAVESDLDTIEEELKRSDKYTLLLFDQLDKVVKPILWSRAITPLLNYCAASRFSRLQIKLFIRRDLYNKLGNLTNKNQLDSRIINLEWSIDEMFDLFFKVIISHAREHLHRYVSGYGQIAPAFVKEIFTKAQRPHSYNQFNAEPAYLRPLVEVFFGKLADSQGTFRFGESYDWFYTNLRNADDTISLRPFLDLVFFALDEALKDTVKNSQPYPALSQSFFNASARSQAVERHLYDLIREEGNELLGTIVQDIMDEVIPQQLKLTTLLQHEFDQLAQIIISNHQELKTLSAKDIEQILKENGIISVNFKTGGGRVYTFAFLYKYYLGLKSPNKIMRRRSYST